MTITVARTLGWMFMAMLLAAAPAGAQESELQSAYKKEFAFLVAQKRALVQRLAELNKESKREVARARQSLESLESRMLARQSEADTLEELVLESERSVEESKNNKEILQATFMQADSTLEKNGKPALVALKKDGADDGQRIERLFGAGAALVDELSSIRRMNGEFFLTNGTKVSGRIIKVGDIASYGISEKGSGILAPAGGGQLKLWMQPAPEAAAAMDKGHLPDRLKVFLYESLDREAAGEEKKSALEVIDSGGTIAWIIVALGVLAAGLIVLRVMFLKSASASSGKLTAEIGELLRDRRVDAALEKCKRARGATSRVLAATIRNLDREREHLEDIVSESILHESAHLNRFGPFILVLAAVSPLLGLLGTVTGMISTFDVITEFGTGDPKLLSGGIAIALVTTEIGLIVAIPTLLVGNLLSSWAERIKDEMEKAALRITNIYLDTTPPHTQSAAA